MENVPKINITLRRSGTPVISVSSNRLFVHKIHFGVGHDLTFTLKMARVALNAIKIANLQPVKKIHVEFDPFHEKVRSVR